MLDLLVSAPPVSVVIPAFNAPAELRACLESVVRNTGTATEVVVIDDDSTDPGVGPLLAHFRDEYGIRVLSNATNLGFVATANRGFEAVSGDVILLNSDTRVPPRWVERLRFAAYSHGCVATVTPLTNAEGAFSAPGMPGPNEVPASSGGDLTGRAVARSAALVHVETPTGNGFCMYVKRAALKDVGFFDAVNFPRGYGEENDFSMRARQRGWRHLVDASTYVLHTKSASFGPEREELSRKGTLAMDRLHPSYRQEVAEFLRSEEMKTARSRVEEAFSLIYDRSSGRPRVLYVLHDYGGGTPLTTRDLGEEISQDWEPLILKSTGSRLIVSDLAGSRIEEIRLSSPIRFGPEFNGEYRDAVTRLLIRYDIELVHIRHLLKHSLDLPVVADSLNIPTVLSLHDFYYCCPTAHLLDNEDRFCHAVCTSGQGECRASPWVLEGPHLKHEWVYVWRQQVERMFSHIDAFVWTTDWARRLYLQSFPSMGEADLRIIEHGRSLKREGSSLGRPPESGEPVRVAVLGHVGIHKGADLLREAAEASRGRIDFHVVGTLEGAAVPGLTVHGRYDREKLLSRLEEIGPSFVLLSSITGETYSHTVTEAWAAGIPVIVGDLGAPAERVAAQGGGWVIPLDSGADLVSRIMELTEDSESWHRAASEAAQATWPSRAEMGSAYLDLYREVTQRRLTLPRRTA
ncbi:MAG: glycosyltransferase [Acidimicrobiia bacterium]